MKNEERRQKRRGWVDPFLAGGECSGLPQEGNGRGFNKIHLLSRRKKRRRETPGHLFIKQKRKKKILSTEERKRPSQDLRWEKRRGLPEETNRFQERLRMRSVPDIGEPAKPFSRIYKKKREEKNWWKCRQKNEKLSGAEKCQAHQ